MATRANDFYAQCDGSTKRCRVSRAFAGWRGSALAGYLYEGDRSTYLQNFRMSRQTLKLLCRMIQK
eukprot:4845216-Pleurochrysis_carterae.AAC.1